MNASTRTKHSVDMIFSVILFGMFTMMFLLLIIFSSKAYGVSLKGLEENQNLHTAMNYITTKMRQHDGYSDIAIDQLENMTSLCLYDEIDDQVFTTWIYLDGNELKELFTVPGASVSPSVGTVIASLKHFQIEWTEQGYLKLFMEDMDGNTGELLFHTAPPHTLSKEALA